MFDQVARMADRCCDQPEKTGEQVAREVMCGQVPNAVPPERRNEGRGNSARWIPATVPLPFHTGESSDAFDAVVSMCHWRVSLVVRCS